MAEAPFDNRSRSGFAVDGDLRATARPVRRGEKNAFLDVRLTSRRFEQPTSSVWQNAKHRPSVADALQPHIRVDVKAQSKGLFFGWLACFGGTQAVGSLERPPIMAQENPALVNEAEARFIAIMCESYHCSRGLVEAFDIDLVRARDDLVAEPFL